MKVSKVGDGKVYLLAGGGRVFADMAAKFVRLEKPVAEIVDSPYNASLVKSLLSCGHLSALEFDNFIFGVEGYSRVTEVQLVRKRMASYLIKSGRAELDGMREYSVVLPANVLDATVVLRDGVGISVKEWLRISEDMYNYMVSAGIKEEDARYIKPQATEFKAIIAMNAHALIDWFKIRCCRNAQFEIRDMANKMLKLCKEAAPDLFQDAGPSCVSLGYCPENSRQHHTCVAAGKYLQKDVAKGVLESVVELA